MNAKRAPRAIRKRRWLWTVGILVIVCLLLCVFVAYVGQRAQRDAVEAYGPELASLCAEYESATELPGTIPDGKLVVLQDGGKLLHRWHRALPDERRAESADEVDYAACVRSSSHTVEVCRYTIGGRVKRIRYSYDITFIDPELGAPVAFREVYGSNPSRCPETKEALKFRTETIKGEKPEFETLASLLQASPNSIIPTVISESPQDEPMRPEPTAAKPTPIKVKQAQEFPEAAVTPGSEPPETAEVTGSPSLWSGPDRLGEYMGIFLNKGDRVEILATTERWTKVRWVSPEGDEVIGWALSQFVGKP